MRYGPPEQRFWEHVQGDGVETCWVWKSVIRHNGYGQFKIGNLAITAHRWAYEHLRAPIPAGLVIDHLCRNRACVNPWHLEPVTQRENTLRGESPVARNAAKTHCLNDHPFDAENTGTDSDGNRFCRTCATEQQRARKQRRARNV